VVKSVTVHGKCSAISDGNWQVFPMDNLDKIATTSVVAN
jgi:hypothetical protein